MSAKKNKWFSNIFNNLPQQQQAKQSSSITKPKQDSTKRSDTKTIVQSFKDSQFMTEIEPKTESDLAVHPKKILELKTWLEDHVVSPIPQVKAQNVSMLLLTGPTGSGKTTALKVLCKTANINIQEWINPIDKDYELYKGPGQASQLTEFLIDSQYPSLFVKHNKRKKISLIEDFPNILLNNLPEFDNVLSNCVANAKSVIVFICSDANSQSLNIVRNLFTDEMKAKYNIYQIAFNACSVTLLKQALNRAQAIVKQNLSTLTVPSAEVMDAVINSCMGDLRCAINQYYFAALKGSASLPLQQIKNVKEKDLKRKRNSKRSTIKSMMKDESLGLFHSLGRVLNPKRIEHNNSWRINCQFDPLIDELATQPTTMNSFLQENYIKYFGDLNDIQKAADFLSLSQSFLEKWNDRHDIFVNALWISVLGLMVYNEHKVSKWTQIRGPVKIVKEAKCDLESGLLSTDMSYYNTITGADKVRFTFKK